MNATRTLLTFVCVVVIGTATRVNADFFFGEPNNLGPTVNSSLQEATALISPDGLSLWFWRGADWNDVGEWWVATRATKDDPWGSAVDLGRWNDSLWELIDIWPGFTTPDGLELYLADYEPPLPAENANLDLWMKTRETTDANWGAPINLGPVVNSSAGDFCPCISPDGLELYFSSGRPGGQGSSDIWVTKRVARNAPWGAPVNLGLTVNSLNYDAWPWLSADGLVLFFNSWRPTGWGEMDLYMTRRATLSSPWGQAVNLGPIVNCPAYEEYAYISTDGSTLFFDCERPGGYGGADVWQVSIEPVVDLNHDGKVDEEDKMMLMQHWGQNDPSFDMGPMPWGDGIVDEADLAVLMSYWGREVDDPPLVAHWELDEVEGSIAHDSEGENDGVVHGDAVWQPLGGKLGGALQFDGVDDHVSTPFVLDPSSGPFSVFAWVKGGAPGQVILSQADGANWLMAGAPSGVLMTELKGTGRGDTTRASQAVITDGAWHRVGLSWNGSNRVLYVDNMEVARDKQYGLPRSAGDLHIGAGSQLMPGTFWYGLIDDVRVVDPAKPYRFIVQRDTTGFQIYADNNTPDVYHYYSASQGTIDLSSQTDPAEGACCLYCTGITQYDYVAFNFWPRDMTRLVQEGYVLQFWVRGDSPGTTFDVRFVDTKTSDPTDHPWRMRATISESLARWDGQWHLVRIPLTSLSEYGSYDNNTWYSPEGKFDWRAVQRFDIVSEQSDWVGKEFWFDGIQVAK